MRMSPLYPLLAAAAAIASMGNAGGRAAVSGEGNTGAPGEPNKICISCHNGGNFGPIIELLEITDNGGNLTASYRPGATYNVKMTVAAGAGNPSGYGFQLTALDNAKANIGTFNNLGANVKQVNATNPAGRKYLEHKGGTSATREFTAKWTAPAAGSGDVDFYYIGAVVNGNNAQTGDNGGLGSSITLSEFRLPLPYFDDFEFGSGWLSYPGGPNPSSWECGFPMGAIIATPVSGANAWVTALDGVYPSGEYAYLESPPMDFSLSALDPVIEFAIQYDTDPGLDGGWLEISTDGGVSWGKVGGLDLDWYNDTSSQWGDFWSGFSGGWIYQNALLPGTAGLWDVRVRFVFVSDSGYSFEGIAIDDVVIDELLNPYYDPPEDPPLEEPDAGAEEPPPEDPPPQEPDAGAEPI